MDMKVGYTLAYPVVDGHKGSFCPQGLLHGQGQELSPGKKGAEELWGEIHKGAVVLFGKQKTVAGKEGTMVQEGQGEGIFQNGMAWDLSPDNFAELTARPAFASFGHGFPLDP